VWVLERKYRIDLAYRELKIAIECLGKDGHLNDEAFEYDPVRRNALLLAGWVVLEVTWKRLTEEPENIVAEVRESIRLRSGGR
jgi:very-short-patch-repair endonuclease